MKVSLRMIDPQLRIPGLLMKFLFPPTMKGFRRFQKLGNRARGKKIKGFHCDETKIPSRDKGRSIRIRIYRSQDAGTDDPGILYLHGGGYAINVPESDHQTIKRFLETRNCTIIAPDYRKSLDQPYPAALHDSIDTIRWMMQNHEKLRFRPDQLFIAGSSAGGGLAIATALATRNQVPIAHAFPLYPMIDYRMQTESMKDNNAPVWSELHNRLAWKLYLRNTPQIDELASPSLAEDLTNLPPATTFIGDLDPFRDETSEFFKRLKLLGIQTEIKIFERAFHAFEIVNPRAKVSRKAIGFLKKAFNKAVDNSFSE